jgi:hypothetical protein
MKKTADNKEVPPRCWYYLLDFNDRDDWKTMMGLFDQESLSLLTEFQFWELFKVATQRDIPKV